MALTTTIGGASSDSYGTLAAYEAYVVANIDATFNGHGHDSTHELNLRRAAQYLDRNYQFAGYKQYETQARSWPRLTNILVDGWPIDGDTIPQDIIYAQFELAYAFETDSIDPFATITTGTVKRSKSKAGPVEAETEYMTGRDTPRMVAVEGLLRPYILGGATGQVRMGRG
jgi:hypothetical protein